MQQAAFSEWLGGTCCGGGKLWKESLRHESDLEFRGGRSQRRTPTNQNGLSALGTSARGEAAGKMSDRQHNTTSTPWRYLLGGTVPPPRLPYTVTLGGVVWIHSLKVVIDHGLGRTMRWICKSLFLSPAADRLHTHSKFPRHRLSKHISSSTLCSAVPTHILHLSLAGRIPGARIAAS